MVRLVVYSPSDRFHRELADAVSPEPALTVSLRLRSLPELGEGLDADLVVVDSDDAGEVEEIVRRVAPVPLVLVVGDEALVSAADYARGRCDAWGQVARGDARRVVAAVRAVAAGFVVSDPDSDVRTHHGRAVAEDHDPLTPRERDVLDLLARGRTNGAIAEALGVTRNTVKYHLAGLYAKLDAATRSEAIWQAARQGIISM